MFRVTRIVVAACLALAVAALPMMLDRCAESCDAHHATAAGTPACHHTVSTGPHITKAPAPCGHDHNGTAVTAAKSSVLTDRPFASLAVSTSHLLIESPARVDVRISPHSPPETSPSLGGRTLPLRV
jgi:hypothetical protein